MRLMVQGRSMSIALLCSVLVVCAAAGGAVASTDTVGQPPRPSPDVIPGQYIVILKDSVDHPGNVARSQIDQAHGELGFVYRHALIGYSARLPEARVRALANNPLVAYVEPDVRGGVTQINPRGISRTFADVNPALSINQTDDQRVNADVAVLDSGIQGHPDLNVVARTDCSFAFGAKASECQDGFGYDSLSHGTHVAGTIAALDNGYGVVGIAPGARLWSVKVIDGGGQGDLSRYIAGIDWVTAHAKEIEVANSSLLYVDPGSQAFKDAMKASIEAGVVHVAAAGNESFDAKFYVPANHPDVITVSGLADYDGGPGGASAVPLGCNDRGLDDHLYSKSNFGASIDLVAPAVCIYSTMPDGGYDEKDGTSMAAPHVAGAAAILTSQDSPSNKRQVESIKEVLIRTGNKNWTDTSGDGIQEPLLDVSQAATYNLVSAGARWMSAAPRAGDRALVSCLGTKFGAATCSAPLWPNSAGTDVAIATLGDNSATIALNGAGGQLSQCRVTSFLGASCWSSGVAVATGTSPAATTFTSGTGAGTAVAAFNSSSAALQTCRLTPTGPTNCANHGWVLASGSSPSTAPFGDGSAAVAFRGATGQLSGCRVTWSGGSNCWSSGVTMAAGTTPGIAQDSTNSTIVAFPNPSGTLQTCQLTTGGFANCANQGWVLASGSSATVARLSDGTVAVGFNGATGIFSQCRVWNFGGSGCWFSGVGMTAGTTPAITPLSTGTAMAAFRNASGRLGTCELTASGPKNCADHGWAVSAGSTPSTSPFYDGSAAVVFMDATAQLSGCRVTAFGGSDCWTTPQSLAASTNPKVTRVFP